MFEVQWLTDKGKWRTIIKSETLAQAIDNVDFYRFGSADEFRIIEASTGKVVSE